MCELVTRQFANPCDGTELPYAPGVIRRLDSMLQDVRFHIGLLSAYLSLREKPGPISHVSG